MLRIKKATHIGEYKLKILFSNGKTKIVDFEEWIFAEDHVYLKPLREIGFFKKFQLDESHYTIFWPNGADFSPDTLYEAGVEDRQSRKYTTLQKTKKSRPKRVSTMKGKKRPLQSRTRA